MITCGVDNVNESNGLTPATRVANDVISDDFNSCQDKTFIELENDFKTYSSLTIGQGQIRLIPNVKRNIKAFVQWTKDQFRMELDPAMIPFPIMDMTSILRRHTTHEIFIRKLQSIADRAKPSSFTKNTKWEDWSATFLNFLHSISGRDCVPLSYVIRINDTPDPTPNVNFLDDYVAMAPLNGESFVLDSSEVHTYITNFIAGNSTAESKIQPHVSKQWTKGLHRSPFTL